MKDRRPTERIDRMNDENKLSHPMSDFGAPPPQAKETERTPAETHASEKTAAPQPKAEQPKPAQAEPTAKESAAKKSTAPTKPKTASKSGHTSKKSEEQVNISTAQSAFKVKAKTRNEESSKKGKSSKKNATELELPRSSKPAHKVIPYLLIALALFIGICLVLNLFCNTNNRCGDNPSEHLMGTVGYWVCYGLFGVFGPAVFALPFLIANMAVFWKKYIDNKLVIEKTAISLLSLIFLATTIHAFCLIPIDAEARAMTAEALLENGVSMRGGGVIGGGLAYFLVRYLNIIGGVIVSLFLTLLAAFFFIGMTPQHLWERARVKRSIRQSKKTPLGAEDAEPIKESMKRKHMRAAKREDAPVYETASTNEPPEGAVQYASKPSAPHGKKSEDGLSPRVMPILDASDDTPPDSPLFVPDEILKKEREEEAAARAKAEEAQKQALAKAAAEAQKQAEEEAKRRAELAKKRAAAEQAAREKISSPLRPVSATAHAQQKDDLDPVFPRSGSESKMVKRVQRSDRDFELGRIFINLDDHQEPPSRSHAPLPPEVPLPGSAASTGAELARRAPTTANPRPASSPNAPQAQRPAQSVAGQASGTRTGTPTQTPAQAKAGATVNTNGKPAQKQGPIFRQATPEAQTEYGLSSEEFERREAERLLNTRAVSDKKPTAKPSASPTPKAGEKSKSSATDAKTATASTANATDIKPYIFPPISYLHPGEPITVENMAEIRANMDKLAQTLANFNVRIREITYSCGPTVTRYEIFPDAGVRVRTITNLADDIALSFAVQGVRMEAIAGKSAIGVEVPNTTRSNIYLRDLLESKTFTEGASRLTAGLGADVTGNPLLFDIAKMPHLLVAGTTGSGKSICINCIIMSILFKARPDEVKLVLIDPKKVEFSLYKGLPHLMAPIIVTPKDAAGALQAAVEEMENRFTKIQDVGVHDIAGYNKAAAKDPDLPPMPHVVIIIDELADLMMTARDEVEDSICRLAQKARAAGMHIIVGTQRPSVDVVTGLIKSNIPSRIACTVRSQVDSRTILDFAGAEKLLGRGDMLFAPIGAMKPTRVQGAFVSDAEVEKICEFIRATNGTAQYDENFTSKMKEYSAQCGNKKGGKAESDLSLPSADGSDNKYVDAIRIAIEENRVSTSLLQRKLGIGYSRAAKIIDRMEEEGLVSKQDGSKPRSILISAEQFIERYVEGDAGENATDV